ncbi:MAG TPA: tetratricopeptide repeat protein [Armatimonadaceae bacterium]|nr:tetratricopeptide repeat protein [Armatimonadaceae bacterium]
MALPTGTVTFLFTDIEGSTRLWEKHPDAMRVALARHDDLLARAIAAADGYVFKTAGDAFCAAFATATSGVAAMLAAQVALLAEPWPEETPIKVRMALHTGAVESRDDDYFGPPLNRVARLLSTGHGGQCLLSAASRVLVWDGLPAGVSLHDLGSHQLKDLAQPEQVYQLQHAALPAAFPPLRSLSTQPNNLPHQLTSFIGREEEAAAAQGLLESHRHVTLTGAGGTGKTRLALQVAADRLEKYPDGVWLIELAALADPGLVPQTVAAVFALKEETGKPLLQSLAEYLKSKDLLLVLDNCEHLLDACAKLADTLLRQCPRVRILASSREVLGIAGERTYRVPSLSLPDPEKPQTPESLAPFEAVRLFIDRAVKAQDAFAVTNANAPAVASICHQLDGIPLALELAAARVRSLSVEEIDSRLDQRFRLLTGGPRTALPRQQTLRSLVDWSYDLLAEQEKTLLARLSVFAGGWTLEAAEAVGAGDGVEEWEVLDLLGALVDKSLVLYEEGAAGGAPSPPRYRLLETIRHYGRERLKENGEEVEARQRHLDFFVALSEEAEPHLLDENQQDCVKRLQAEADNLRAALTQSRQSDTQAALRLAGALTWYWSFTNTVGEGRANSAAALSLPGARERTAARAKALIGAAFLSDPAEARSYAVEGLSIAREVGDELLIVWALLRMGDTASGEGNHQAAREHLTESLALCRAMGYWPGTLWALNHLGMTALRQGRAAEARDHWERAVVLARDGHFDSRICFTLNCLAKLNRDESQPKNALGLARESLALVRAAGSRTDFWWTAEIVADLHLDLGEFADARSLLSEAEAFRKAEGWEEWLQPQITMVRACLGLGDYDAARSYLEFSAGMAGSDENGWLQQYRGDVALARQDRDKSRLFYRNSLRLFWKQRDRAGVFLALSGLSATAEEPERSARLHGAADALSRAEEPVRRILKSHARQRQMYESAVAASRVALGDASFAAARDAGEAMPLDAAVEYALGEG